MSNNNDSPIAFFKLYITLYDIFVALWIVYLYVLPKDCKIFVSYLSGTGGKTWAKQWWWKTHSSWKDLLFLPLYATEWITSPDWWHVCIFCVRAFPLALGWYIKMYHLFTCLFSPLSHIVSFQYVHHIICKISLCMVDKDVQHFPLSYLWLSQKPLTLYLHLIYDTRFLLCHGLWSYIMLSHLVTERGRTGGTAQNQCWTSFFTWYIFLLRNKVAARKVHERFFHCLLTHLMLLV